MTSFKTIRPWKPPTDHRSLLRALERPITIEMAQPASSAHFLIRDKTGEEVRIPIKDQDQIVEALPDLHRAWLDSASRCVVLR